MSIKYLEIQYYKSRSHEIFLCSYNDKEQKLDQESYIQYVKVKGNKNLFEVVKILNEKPSDTSKYVSDFGLDVTLLNDSESRQARELEPKCYRNLNGNYEVFYRSCTYRLITETRKAYLIHVDTDSLHLCEYFYFWGYRYDIAGIFFDDFLSGEGGLSDIQEVLFEEENHNFILEDDTLYTDDKKTLVRYFGKKEEYVVADSVLRIFSGAFACNPFIKKVNLNQTKKLGNNIFSYDCSLEEISFADGPHCVLNENLEDCVSFKKIDIELDSIFKEGLDGYDYYPSEDSHPKKNLSYLKLDSVGGTCIHGIRYLAVKGNPYGMAIGHDENYEGKPSFNKKTGYIHPSLIKYFNQNILVEDENYFIPSLENKNVFLEFQRFDENIFNFSCSIHLSEEANDEGVVYDDIAEPFSDPLFIFFKLTNNYLYERKTRDESYLDKIIYHYQKISNIVFHMIFGEIMDMDNLKYLYFCLKADGFTIKEIDESIHKLYSMNISNEYFSLLLDKKWELMEKRNQ